MDGYAIGLHTHVTMRRLLLKVSLTFTAAFIMGEQHRVLNHELRLHTRQCLRTVCWTTVRPSQDGER